MRFRVLLVVMLVLGCLHNVLGSGVARADGPSAADLKRQGDEAMKALNYRDAIALYDRAWAIQQDPAILYNRARALEAVGEYGPALDAIEQFVRIAPDDLKARVPKLAELVADVRAHVAFVVVHCPVAGAAVIVRRRVEGRTPLSTPLRIATGSATIEVEASGYTPYKTDVNLEGGKIVTIEANLVKEKSDEPDQLPVTHEQPKKSMPAGWRIAAFTAGGLGIAGIGVGSIFGVLVGVQKSSADKHCPMKLCDAVGLSKIQDAKTFATVSTIGFIAGGVLLAGSAALFLFAPKRASEPSVSLSIGPGYVGAGGVF
jgi:hypothetical protein